LERWAGLPRLGTFVINVERSFLIELFMTLMAERFTVNPSGGSCPS